MERDHSLYPSALLGSNITQTNMEALLGKTEITLKTADENQALEKTKNICYKIIYREINTILTLICTVNKVPSSSCHSTNNNKHMYKKAPSLYFHKHKYCFPELNHKNTHTNPESWQSHKDLTRKLLKLKHIFKSPGQNVNFRKKLHKSAAATRVNQK
jgi:hypothetical protein